MGNSEKPVEITGWSMGKKNAYFSGLHLINRTKSNDAGEICKSIRDTIAVRLDRQPNDLELGEVVEFLLTRSADQLRAEFRALGAEQEFERWSVRKGAKCRLEHTRLEANGDAVDSAATAIIEANTNEIVGVTTSPAEEAEPLSSEPRGPAQRQRSAVHEVPTESIPVRTETEIVPTRPRQAAENANQPEKTDILSDGLQQGEHKGKKEPSEAACTQVPVQTTLTKEHAGELVHREAVADSPFTLVPTDKLRMRHPFSTLFRRETSVFTRIVMHMRAHGYDYSQPIVAWRNGDEELVVDGSTRLDAARETDQEVVSVVYKQFADEKEALDYAIHNQRDRRNLTDAAIQQVVEVRYKPVQGFRGASSARTRANGVKTSQKLAKSLNIGKTKVEMALFVERYAPDLSRQVKLGEISIHAAHEKAKKIFGAKKMGALRQRERPIETQCVTVTLPYSVAQFLLEAAKACGTKISVDRGRRNDAISLLSEALLHRAPLPASTATVEAFAEFVSEEERG